MANCELFGISSATCTVVVLLTFSERTVVSRGRVLRYISVNEAKFSNPKIAPSAESTNYLLAPKRVLGPLLSELLTGMTVGLCLGRPCLF